MKELDLSTVVLEHGETYKYEDYEVTVCRKFGNNGDKYNVVIERGSDVSSCHGLTCQEILSIVGCVQRGFVEPQRVPVERGDGVIRHSQFDTVLDLIEMDIPVYLYGPAGSGKNILCKQIADELGLDFYFSNSVTQEYKITGFIDAGGTYHETEFYKAFTKGGLFMLDELDASAPEVLICLNAALANRYFDFPTGRVKAHEDFRVISAGNTCGRGADEVYSGRAVIDGATLDRFAYVEILYDSRVEDAIAQGDTEITAFIREMRKAAESRKIQIVLGYRAIDRLSKMSSKFTVKQCVSMAVTKGMASDEMRMLYHGINLTRNRFQEALGEMVYGG